MGSTGPASQHEIDEIRLSGLFDAKWYVDTYPDVRFSGMDPVEHYLLAGARLGRNPSAEFNGSEYLHRHGDLVVSGDNPLLHYIRSVRGREGEGSPGRHRKGLTRERIAASSVTIVIPVYNAPEATRDCLRSVVAHTDPSVRVIAIDDCSPDPEVDRVMTELAGHSNIRIVRNHRNLGYTATVNLGIHLAGKSDVVLLNSDTRVTPRWLGNLRLAAYSGERVATATPFSDNAGAFSAPRINETNARPEGMSDDDYARCVTRGSGRLYPATPTGNGFCMYIQRAAIDEVGDFDAVSFPRGYGEENDFCVRATRAGWKHVIDDATLIFHVRSASFGSEREGLVRTGRGIIDERYPEYTAAVRAFLVDPRVDRARSKVGEAGVRSASASPVRPRVLFVISTTTGGTPQTNGDLMSALQDRYEPYLLVCDSRRLELYAVDGDDTRSLASVELQKRILPFPHTSGEYDALADRFLIEHSIELVHIRHIGWHSVGLPEVCKALGIPVVFSFHDFYTICPTIKLLDENLVHCGGVCTSTRGRCRPELWHEDDMPNLKHNAVRSWQQMMRAMLATCDLFVTTSQSALAQMLSKYGELADRCRVIPHGRDLTFERLAPAEVNEGHPTKVLVPGNIGVPKGALLLEELIALDTQGRFEFHVLGRTSVKDRPGLVLHGTYDRDEFTRRVQAINPAFGLILSIWPETHCHTLTELWSCGLPAAALDYGAVGERIRKHGGGWLIRHGDAAYVYAELKEIAGDQPRFEQSLDAVHAWQRGAGIVENTAWMADQYDALYQGLLVRDRLALSRAVA